MDVASAPGIQNLLRLLLEPSVTLHDRLKATTILKAHARCERGRYHIISSGKVNEIVALLEDHERTFRSTQFFLSTSARTHARTSFYTVLPINQRMHARTYVRTHARTNVPMHHHFVR